MFKKLFLIFMWIGMSMTREGVMAAELEKATFGAGCFWGVEKVFADLTGVVQTQVGYTGGKKASPTYEEVCTGRTGHAEAIEITFNPRQITYRELIEIFWTHHDPTTYHRQGNDIGSQYRSAIFYHSDAQKKEADKTKLLLDQSKLLTGPVVTEIAPASVFYPAEAYHQKYLKKNPNGYCHLLLQAKKVKELLLASRS